MAGALAAGRTDSLRAQRGVVLVTSLIILTIMTVIGLNAMRSVVLEERMAGNLKEQTRAFQAAEAGVQAALTAIERSAQPPQTNAWGTASLVDACTLMDPDTDSSCTLLEDILADWKGAEAPALGVPLSSFGDTGLKDLSADAQPRVVVESRYVGLGEEENFEVAVQRRGVHLYTVTALGTGPAGQSEVILQTTIPKVYDW